MNRPSGELFSNKALFERSRDPIFVLNRRRRLRYANPAFEQLLGQPLSELYNLHCIRDRRASAQAQALAPPAEALAGTLGLVRRPVPPARVGPPWWDISYFPVNSQDGLLALIGRIVVVGTATKVKAPALPEALMQLRQRLKLRYSWALMESAVPAVRKAAAQARVAAANTAPVLVIGETGVGKRILARILHHCGITADRSILEVDCGGLPPSAIERLLFGPAGLDRPEMVGSIVLRDPAALPREVQARLTRELATTTPRFIATTRIDFADDINAGRLLPDFAEALDIQRIHVPALRERLDDLPRLVDSLLSRLRPNVALAPETMAALAAYSWPGNLRELRHVLEAASERGRDLIGEADLPDAMRLEAKRDSIAPSRRVFPLEALTDQFRRRLVLLALKQARGHRNEAARLLDLSRTELWRRMNQLGIGEDDWRSITPRGENDAPSADRPV